MTPTPQINQRDLRNRSKEIMDGVEQGQTYTVMRDGHSIGQLVPLRRKPRFVSSAVFAGGTATAPDIDPDRFRADLDRLDSDVVDRFDQ